MLISNPVKLGGLTCQSRKENTNQNNAKRISIPELPVLNQDKFVSFKGLNKLPLGIMNNNNDYRIITTSSALLSRVSDELDPKDVLPVGISKVKTSLVAKVIADKCRESAKVLMSENINNPLKNVLDGMDSMLSTLRALGRLDDNKNNTINTAIDLYNEFQAKPIKFPKSKLLQYDPNEQLDILNFISKSPEKFNPEVLERLTKLDDNHFAMIFKEDELYEVNGAMERLTKLGDNNVAMVDDNHFAMIFKEYKLYNEDLLKEYNKLITKAYTKIAISTGQQTHRTNNIFNRPTIV